MLLRGALADGRGSGGQSGGVKSCRIDVRRGEQVHQDLCGEQEEGEEDQDAGDGGDKAGALLPAQAVHRYPPMLSTALPAFPDAPSKIPRNATHMAAPNRAMISTAIAAYKFGRVIRLKQADVDAFVEGSRIEPGTLEHLYPEARKDTSVTDANAT